MTGTRAWFPTAGSAGGYPGATMHFALRHADGQVEPVGIHAVGVRVAPGDHFEMKCASGGGYGDPLDRDPDAVTADLAQGRVDAATAREVYGVVFTADDAADHAATGDLREAIRRDRLALASPAVRPVPSGLARPQDISGEEVPLYPGVVQRGRHAVATGSGALLAIAPDNWLDDCLRLDRKIDERVGGLLARAHLDPLTGRMLHVDVIRAGDGPGIAIRPDRWTKAGSAVSPQGSSGVDPR
jgi:N-methylhydantoinase B